MQKHYYISLSLLGLIVSFCGCSGNGIRVNYVEGTVTWKDTPVAGAMVTFEPTGDGTDVYVAFGRTDEQGQYVLTTQASEYGSGAVAGSYKVSIARPSPGASGRPSQTSDLPGVYAEGILTPLTAEVERGRNRFDFNLEGETSKKTSVKPRALAPTTPPPGMQVPE